LVCELTLSCNSVRESKRLRLRVPPYLQEELGSPALAFVKTLCHLLALDSAVLDEVLVLRRQLLRLIHCKEFSAESEFKVCMAVLHCGTPRY
jgi:hypothetical protein